MFNFKCEIMEITREQYHKSLVGVVPKKYHKKMLEEFDKKELEDKYKTCPDCCYDVQDSEGDIMEHECLIHKRMNNINTFQAHKNEVCLRGTDEYGKDFTVWFDSYDFLGWIDIQNVQYIKEQLTKYIEEK